MALNFSIFLPIGSCTNSEPGVGYPHYFSVPSDSNPEVSATIGPIEQFQGNHINKYVHLKRKGPRKHNEIASNVPNSFLTLVHSEREQTKVEGCQSEIDTGDFYESSVSAAFVFPACHDHTTFRYQGTIAIGFDNAERVPLEIQVAIPGCNLMIFFKEAHQCQRGGSCDSSKPEVVMG